MRSSVIGRTLACRIVRLRDARELEHALGLIAIDKALERLCDDVTARRGIRIHFTSSHVPRSVPHDVSLGLFPLPRD
jgi:signal transduction histidine kinase